MAKLISDFFCVAQSGETIDDREINPSWLTDAARDYNADFYAARIWYEHIRYYGAMGDVFAVKAEKDKETGIVRLFNRIIPSPELIELKRGGNCLYSSIEVSPKLKLTGRAYQRGLGVTDSPASFGTDRLEFSAKPPPEEAEDSVLAFKDAEDSIFTASLEVPDIEFSKERSIFDFFKRNQDDKEKEKPAPKKPTKDHLEMNKEEFDSAFDSKMDELLGKQNTAFNEVLEQHKTAFKEEMENAVKPLQEQLEKQETQINEFKEQQAEIIKLGKEPGDNGDNGRDEHHGGDSEKTSFNC